MVGADDGGGSLISLDRVAPICKVGVSASVVFPCTIKSRRSFVMAPAHPGNPGIRVKQLCVFDYGENTRVLFKGVV